jgi:glycosyltransferase involved in cell wall biosynthesis
MRILYVITGLGMGGAEKVVCNLADEMVNQGHEVKIAYLTGNAIVHPVSKNIEIIYLALNDFSSFISASLNYHKLIKRYQPDVVHAHMIHANLFTRLNRLFNHLPLLISSAHSSNEGGKLRMLTYFVTHNLADVTTNVSKNASKIFIEQNAVKSKDIITVYNGVDLQKFSKLNKDDRLITEFIDYKDKKIILSVGSFSDAKDYPNLITAISTLAEIRQDFILLIAGEGSLRTEVESLIESLNLKGIVRLLGNRNDIPQLMAFADIFVLSSKYEGLPTVLIEAMACEKFVVATDCGGSDEILGDTGFLVPIQNSDLLSKAINKALNLSEEEKIANGVKARRRVEEEFSLNSNIQRWLKIYESK